MTPAGAVRGDSLDPGIKMDDQLSVDYDHGLSGPYSAHRTADPSVLEALRTGGGLHSRSRVLEVGCGTGNYLVALSKDQGCRCWGIDPSQEMLAVARSRLRDLRLQRGWAEQLPFEDGAFDCVFSVDVIHHVQDRPTAFSEALRVLRPGGKVAVATDDEETIRGRVHSRYFPETIAVELVRYPSMVTLREGMTSVGFADPREERTASPVLISDAAPYREKAFSSLHLIPEAAFRQGLDRLERDLATQPISHVARYVLLWGTKSKPEPGSLLPT